MKLLKKKIALAALLIASPLAATAVEVEVSANVALTTDYRFRGISQTDEKAAIQGGFDVALDNGIYIGTWGSNVDFANSLELDYYIGFANDINEDWSYDVGYIYYDYPGADSTQRVYNSSAKDDYQELYAKVSFRGFTLGGAYSDDYYLETGKFYYLHGEYTYTFTKFYDIGLDLHVGNNNFEYKSTDSNLKHGERAFLTDGEDSYWDYSIGLTKGFMGVDFTLTWVDTDLNKGECFGENWCDSTFIFAVSKSL